MGSRKATIISLLMLVVLLGASFNAIHLSGPDDSVAGIPTRATGENLEIENRTYSVSYRTGSEEWDTVFIWDNATLEIEGAVLKAKRVICKGDTVNTALRVINHEGTQGLLSITEGVLNVKADTVQVIGSRITVVNGTSPIPNGVKGGNSEISLLAKSSDLVVTDSELNVRGHDGGLGDSENFGGRGGKSYLFLGAKGSNKAILTGSEFQVEGGAGGNGFAPNSGAGEGGEATFDIDAETVQISTCSFFTKGGKAGAHSESNPGSTGGNSFISVKSIQDTYIFATDMESEVGINTNNEPLKQSFIILKSSNRKVFWDHEKDEASKMVTLSHTSADTLNIDSKTGAELHQVDTGDDAPQPLGAGALKIYWWARIEVKDKYDEPITGAKITYTIDPDPLPYPRDGAEIITDDAGKVDLEIIARENQDWNKYSFQAEDYGGALGTSDQFRFDNNMNLPVPIEIVRMVLEIEEPADLTKPMGDEVDFRGSAIPGNSGNIVQNVTLYIDQNVIGYAKDDSEVGAPPFSTWLLENWDSTTVADGLHELLIIGIDSAYQVRVTKNIRIDQTAVNHRPTLDLVIFSDGIGSYPVSKDGSADIHVNQDDSIISFDVEVYERDMLSTILQIGQGVKVIKATIDLIHIPTGAVVLNDKVIGEDDIEKINLTGGYGFSFELDANKRPGTDEPYKEGGYRVLFKIEDDGGMVSREESVNFVLFFDFYPWIGVYIEPNIRPSTDREFAEESFVVETKDSDIYTAKFNLTDSWDRDDPLWSSDPTEDRSWSNLRFTFEVMDPEGNRETVFGPDGKGAGFSHDLNVKDIKSGEQGIFTLLITCKDQEGLESTLRLKMRVTHNPAPKDVGIGGQEFGLPGDLMMFISPALLFIMLLAFLVVFIMIQRKNLSEKNKKMELLEKKRKEDEKTKASSAIEDEFTAGRTQDSREYLKKFGADKGKDEFARELQASQDRGVSGDPIPQIQQKVLPPVTAPEVKPPEAIKPGQATAVPQQQPPLSPAAHLTPPIQQQPPMPKAAGPVPVRPPTPLAPPQQAPPAAPAAPVIPPPAPGAPAAPRPPLQPQ